MKCKGEKDKKKRYISDNKKRKKKGRSTKLLLNMYVYRTAPGA